MAIHDGWDWSARHPVLHLSFGGGNFQAPGSLHNGLMAQLDAVERRSGVSSDYRSGAERLSALIGALHRKTGRPVAVLVDEYDKPILDTLDTPEVARANRDFLRGVYSVVKDADAHIRFPSSTLWTRRRLPAPTATSCAASIPSVKKMPTRTSGSVSSPG